jgi:hypothetical protein
MGEPMPFPLTIDGRLDIPLASPTADNVKQVVTVLSKRISELRPRRLQRDGNEIKFYGNVFRIAWISNWNRLAMVGPGLITVSSDPRGITIDYRLGVVSWFGFTTVITLSASAVAAVIPGETLSHIVVFPIFMWLLLFVGNYMIALMRFRSLLHHAVCEMRSIDDPAV